MFHIVKVWEFIEKYFYKDTISLKNELQPYQKPNTGTFHKYSYQDLQDKIALVYKFKVTIYLSILTKHLTLICEVFS